MLGAGEDGCESGPMALGIFLQQPAKDAFGVLPQHLHGVISPTGVR